MHIPPEVSHSGGHTAPKGAAALAAASLAALGVVYGDIGTSPLYAFKAALDALGTAPGTHPLEWQVKGVLCLIFWTLVLVVAVKYVVFILRADNEGEGGILALMSLLDPRGLAGGKRRPIILILGLFGCTMLMGDGIITPAISVLSAVEGSQTIAPALKPLILPLSIGILIGLFAVQRLGTAAIARFFGPTMTLWFLSIGAVGLAGILRHPGILDAVDPRYALHFALAEKATAFAVFGAVFLVATGGEALYADLGHCGRGPIRWAWFGLVLPALLLNYFGQGALVLDDPAALDNPFFLAFPEAVRAVEVVLATAATVIASQALISGVFSLTKQAIQLGFCPRFQVKQTNAGEIGQIYLPVVNWALMAGAIALILGFKKSDDMAAAYGIAVSLTMLTTTPLVCLVMRGRWRWGWPAVALFGLPFVAIDALFSTSNMLKLAEGGWVPLSIGICMFLVMTTWERGATAVRERLAEMSVPLERIAAVLRDAAVADMAPGAVARVPGTSVFLTKTAEGLPPVVSRYIATTRSVPEHVVILNFQTARVPRLHRGGNLGIEDLGHGFWRVTARYGYMQIPSVRATLKEAALIDGLKAPVDAYTLVLGSEVVTRKKVGSRLNPLQATLYRWMAKNATRAALFFRLPKDDTLEFVLHIEV